MKAIFLCESKDKINQVFDKQTITALQTKVDLGETVYSKKELLQAPKQFADVEIVFSTWGMPEMTEEEIGQCLPKLRCVFYGAGSVQKFARPFLSRGVKVFSAWAANAVPVAEMAAAQIILANKGYYLSSRIYHKNGNRAARVAVEKCKGNYGETVGIIGAGMIGRLVIQMLGAYNLKVAVFDPFLSDDDAACLNVEKCDLPSLFERAFTISNHLANNEHTKGMLNYELFRRMRENAVFINTGRGAQVVEDDLVRVLRERPDLTALLDVTDPEPPVDGHPFYTLDNCLLTPHIAGSAGDEVRRMGEYMLNELEVYLAGGRCRYEVDEKMLATMA